MITRISLDLLGFDNQRSARLLTLRDRLWHRIRCRWQAVTHGPLRASHHGYLRAPQRGPTPITKERDR